MSLTSNRVATDNLHFKKVTAQLLLSPEQIVLQRSKLTPAHGNLTAHGSYNRETRTYQFDFLGKGLWAGDFTKNQVLGIMRTHGSINGRVPEKLPGVRGLFGKVSLKISPVNFEKADEVKTILAVINPAFFRKQNLRGLRFDYLGGNFKIINGKFNTSNLTLKGKPMDVYFEGLFDGYSQSLNMLGKATPKFKRGLTKTHFKLVGPASHPQMTLLGIKSQAD